MTNASHSSAHSARARGGPHLHLAPDTIAAVIVGAGAIPLLIIGAVALALEIAVGDVCDGPYCGTALVVGGMALLGALLIVFLAVGIARHRRKAQVLGLIVCAFASIYCVFWLIYRLNGQLLDFWNLALYVGVGGPAGMAAILLSVALRQKPNPGG